MLTAWWILDAIYDNPLAFIKDLMQEIRAVSEFKEEDCEKMMEYYMLLQSHIAEADKADVGAMLLIPANIADMTRVLPYAEAMERPAGAHPSARHRQRVLDLC
jgi:hypothetical protein